MNTLGRVLAAASLGLVAAACGGGSSPTSPGPSGGGTPQPTTITGSVAAYAITSHTYTAAQAGTLTVSLTWTSQADLDLYVTASTCTGYPPDACVILARATTSSGQREDVSMPVAANTALIFWVDNFHPQTAATYSLTAVVR
jgi:ABC-type glycerol-3-phosphate transport system substrate-binding protein